MNFNLKDYKVISLTLTTIIVILVLVLSKSINETRRLEVENIYLLEEKYELAKELEIANEVFNKQASFYTSLFVKLKK